MPTALVFLAPGFEEMEATAPVDILRRAGVTVTVATIQAELATTGRNSITWVADTRLAEVADQTFDLLIVPGGPGHAALRREATVRAMLQAQATRGGLIGAICAAPLVLLDAGLLAGKAYTAHPSAAGELTAIQADQPVVVDGQIITSRGAGTAARFGLALAAALVSPAKADEIAGSICL